MGSEYTHVVILDFEATCDDRDQPWPQEIIEFPSVLMSLRTLETVDEFQSFVRPYHHPVLTEFCLKFTSISQADVDAAGTFPEVLADHEAWLTSHGLEHKNTLLVTCGDWDLATMLPAQCLVAVPPIEALPPIYTRWQNIKRTFCSVRKRPRALGMSGMLNNLGLPLTGHHHRGIDDCRNIVELYRALLQRGATTEVTAELPVSKYPPITIHLRHDDRVEQAMLTTRSLKALRELACGIFRCRVAEFHRQEGSPISMDQELLTLTPGEEILVS